MSRRRMYHNPWTHECGDTGVEPATDSSVLKKTLMGDEHQSNNLWRTEMHRIFALARHNFLRGHVAQKVILERKKAWNSYMLARPQDLLLRVCGQSLGMKYEKWGDANKSLGTSHVKQACIFSGNYTCVCVRVCVESQSFLTPRHRTPPPRTSPKC